MGLTFSMESRHVQVEGRLESATSLVLQPAGLLLLPAQRLLQPRHLIRVRVRRVCIIRVRVRVRARGKSSS